MTHEKDKDRAAAQPLHGSDGEFEQLVLKSKLPVVVDFWAPWCGPCRALAPYLDKLAADYAGRLVVVKVNIDDNSRYAETYRVQGIPTLLFIRDGELEDTQVGMPPYAHLVAKFDALAADPAAGDAGCCGGGCCDGHEHVHGHRPAGAPVSAREAAFRRAMSTAEANLDAALEAALKTAEATPGWLEAKQVFTAAVGAARAGFEAEELTKEQFREAYDAAEQAFSQAVGTAGTDYDRAVQAAIAAYDSAIAAAFAAFDEAAAG